jgi:hypothetical protein
MTANFQILEKWENLSIELYMWVSSDIVLRDRFFRILFVMRSFPGALPGGNFLIIYCISPGKMGFAGSDIGSEADRNC